MGVSATEPLPEEIFHLIAEQCPGYGDGFKLWCKLAAAFPRLCGPLPRATLSQMARQNLSWEGDCELLDIICKTHLYDGFRSPLKLCSPGLPASLTVRGVRRTQVGVAEATIALPCRHLHRGRPPQPGLEGHPPTDGPWYHGPASHDSLERSDTTDSR